MNKKNPNWVRPLDWPYEEDWGSDAWTERMRLRDIEVFERREKFGFDVCPKCQTVHTAKTLMCRNCSYKAVD